MELTCRKCEREERGEERVASVMLVEWRLRERARWCRMGRPRVPAPRRRIEVGWKDIVVQSCTCGGCAGFREAAG